MVFESVGSGCLGRVIITYRATSHGKGTPEIETRSQEEEERREGPKELAYGESCDIFP
jgi:hypothetical protein